MKTTIDGLKAKHAIITPECRINRNNDGAIEEALGRIKNEYQEILKVRNDNPTFHVVLTVDDEKTHNLRKISNRHETGPHLIDMKCKNRKDHPVKKLEYLGFDDDYWHYNCYECYKFFLSSKRLT